MPTTVPAAGTVEGQSGHFAWAAAVKTAIDELVTADATEVTTRAAAITALTLALATEADARVWADAPNGVGHNFKIDPTLYTAPTVGAALTIATGIGTGNDIVEPMILFDASAPFLGYEYVLVAAPYYQSNAIYENPTLWVSHDGTTWVPVVNGVATVGGTATPLVPNASQGDGNLSDPYIVRGPDGTFYVLYNQILNSTGAGGTGTGGKNWAVKGIQADSLGGPWTTPVTMISTVLASDRPSTPSMFWDGRRWVMYAIDLMNVSSTTISLYTCPDANPLTGTWTKQASPTITLPTSYASNRVWWHLNAYRIGTQHVLLIQDNVAGTSGGGHLWLVTSDNEGSTFTVPNEPMINLSNTGYRGAIIPQATGLGLKFDLFYGFLSTTWQLRRTTATATQYGGLKYGGLTESGLPINTLATEAAKVPLAPYLFGDTARRADSAVTPGTADSGTAWTVSAGTWGIRSNKIYCVSGNPARIAAPLAGLADSVATCEIVTAPAATQAYLITRWVDASNYVRFGWPGGTAYVLQNIVGGSISQTGTTVVTTTSAASDVIAIRCSGSNIYAYVNGVLVAVGVGWTANQAGSGAGLQTNNTTADFRNVTARPLIGGY